MRHWWEKTDKRSAVNLWWRRAVEKLRDSSEQEAAVWLDCDSDDLDSLGIPVGRKSIRYGIDPASDEPENRS